MKRLAILGSTGSIGTSALDVVGAHPDAFEVVALAAGSNLDLLEQQVRRFAPPLVSLASETAARELRRRLASGRTEVTWGRDGGRHGRLCHRRRGGPASDHGGTLRREDRGPGQ
jgi:1-deoxy-D-xylulose-5-phosphate reductoisomerase